MQRRNFVTSLLLSAAARKKVIKESSKRVFICQVYILNTIIVRKRIDLVQLIFLLNKVVLPFSRLHILLHSCAVCLQEKLQVLVLCQVT